MIIFTATDPSLDKIIDAVSKLIETAGKGPLYLCAFIILVIAVTADRWIFSGSANKVAVKGKKAVPRNSTPLFTRIVVWLIELAMVIFLVLVFVNPSTKLKPCSGSTIQVFTPLTPGVLGGDMGDAGNGQRWNRLTYKWKAPAKVVGVNCVPGRSTYLVAQGPAPEDQTIAQCIAKTDGGNDPITVTISWDGECPDDSSLMTQISDFFKALTKKLS